MEKLAAGLMTKLISRRLFHNWGTRIVANLLYHRAVYLVQIKEFIGIQGHKTECFHCPPERGTVLLL